MGKLEEELDDLKSQFEELKIHLEDELKRTQSDLEQVKRNPIGSAGGQVASRVGGMIGRTAIGRGNMNRDLTNIGYKLTGDYIKQNSFKAPMDWLRNLFG